MARSLVGIAQLESTVAVPAALRGEYSDERWLSFRLNSVRGLAAYHVLSAMRSSRAALVEHLVGTAASERYGLGRFKPVATGDVVGKLQRLAAAGPPEVHLVDCDVPDWLSDDEQWKAACDGERGRYLAMDEAAGQLSAAREAGKAALLADLAHGHERVLAFDRHPATLEQLRGELAHVGVEVVVATGTSTAERRRVEALFERTSSRRAIALCSEAMNEGLNLQGASAVVHLDLPTTLRVAEQRIGRVDRMDSPHDAIEACWPKDGPAFATRADELFAQRAAESEQLLGSNLRIPVLVTGGDIVDVEERIAEAEAPGAESWDGIRDALEPVRSLVGGERALVAPRLYDELRQVARSRVVSVVEAATPWAFLAVAATVNGPPRWLFWA
ncbi:MAG: helicase-related protein [Acidimicrobiales bacterium]